MLLFLRIQRLRATLKINFIKPSKLIHPCLNLLQTILGQLTSRLDLEEKHVQLKTMISTHNLILVMLNSHFLLNELNSSNNLTSSLAKTVRLRKNFMPQHRLRWLYLHIRVYQSQTRMSVQRTRFVTEGFSLVVIKQVIK